MPLAISLDGSEEVPIVQPAGATSGVSKRTTTQAIGNTANIGAVSVGISNLTQLNAANGATDFLAILHSDGIVYKVSPSGLNLTAGNMPVGGTISQFLIKNTATNFDTVWATMTGDVVMSGTASFSATIVTAAITYAKIQNVAGLSVVGNGSSTSAVPGAITGVTNQVLVVNPGGTGVAFGQVNLSAAAAVTGFLTSSFMTGILAVPFGGIGTSALTAFGVLLGNGTSAVTIATAGAAGQVLTGQTTTSQPVFQTMSGDVTLAATGTATIANGVVTYAKLQAVAALSVVGNGSSASATATALSGTANQILVVNAAGTGLAFGVATAASISTGAITYSRIQNVGGLSVFGNGSTAATVGADLTGTTDQVLVVNSAGTGLGFGRVNLSATASITGALTIVQPATILATTAVPAGGTAGAGYKLSSVANFGVFFGSGVPTLGASTGSLYLRSDGTSTTTRLYINTNGSTTWVGLIATA